MIFELVHILSVHIGIVKQTYTSLKNMQALKPLYKSYVQAELVYMSRSTNIGKWYVPAFAMTPMVRFESQNLIFYLFCVELDKIQMP